MTSTALDLNHAAGATLAIQPGQIVWDTTQLAALDQLGLKDASDGDRAVFLHQCQRTGLDPFARQIYMIGRNEKVPGTQNQWRTKWTIQTGIDGWRVIRDRAERRRGVRGTLSRPIWYDDDGTEHKVWVRPVPPAACELTYTLKDRDGTETPYTSVLQFREYAQYKDGNLIAQWAVKKSHMLEKCCEADVYRKAFPQDFSGVDLDGAVPQDATQADEAPTGRSRGRVTAAEVIGRTETPAAGDDTRRQGTTRNAPPEAAGAASSRGAQPPPPQDQPPSSEGAKADTPAEDQPGSASKDQLQVLHIILGGLGFTSKERDQQLNIAETITGRELTGPHDGRTSKNLSYTEAVKLAHTLDGFGRDRAKLIEHMTELDQDQAGDTP